MLYSRWQWITMVRRVLWTVWFLPVFFHSASAQTIDPEENFKLDSNIRTRSEYVSWFQAPEQNLDKEYFFHHLKAQLGAKYSQEKLEFYLQGQYFQLFDLPQNGVGPGAQYYANNDQQQYPGNVFVRQAYAAYGDTLASSYSYRLALGRMLYANGGEAVNENKAIENLKKQRIHNRLLGTFEFTGGRSFDALRLSHSQDSWGSIGLGAMRPTQGGFAGEGGVQIEEIDLLTVSWSPPAGSLPKNSDAQTFYYFYRDDRDGITKTDNRPLAVRSEDLSEIEVHNFGGHYLQIFAGEQLTKEFLFWGLIQSGDWGGEELLAGALAAEAGFRFPEVWGEPYLRVGYNYGSGDGSAEDNKHHTYFQMLPTVRQYAYLPFYNAMNNQDLFASASVKPLEKTSVLFALHYLQLSNSEDLLYAGSGAGLKDRQFGFTGVKLNGNEIGLLPEITVSYEMLPELVLSAYFGQLLPSSDFDSSSKDSSVSYGFVEANWNY